VIIDDYSNPEFVSNVEDSVTTVIQSEKGRGELLPYYYAKHRWFANAVILHDSVFIQRAIDLSLDNGYKMLWTFRHEWDQADVVDTHPSKPEKQRRHPCLSQGPVKVDGVWRSFHMILSRRSTTNMICLPYSNPSPIGTTDRRTGHCMFAAKNSANNLFGTIHDDIQWGYTFEQYLNDHTAKPVIKVWTGR
jgi:hypothetical protein